MLSNYPPGVTGNEPQITGECQRGCVHCAGECDCFHRYSTMSPVSVCVDCGEIKADVESEFCDWTPCGLGDDHAPGDDYEWDYPDDY